MRNFRTYINEPTGNDPASNNFLGATNIVNFLSELKAAVSRAGLTLSTDDGTPDSNTTQLSESLFLHGVKSSSFQAGGTVNAITLTPVSGSSGVFIPSSYDNIEGAVINFVPTGANTGAVTVSIGQTSGTQLSTKALLDSDGNALSGGEIGADRIEAYYDPTADSANGAWLLTPWSTASSVGSSSEVIHVQDQRTSGTSGGDFNAGSYITRTLNTEVKNTIAGASLNGSSQVTLPVGEYEFEGYAVGHAVDVHKTQLYNVTDAAVVPDGGNGSNARTASPTNASGNTSYISGKVTVTGSSKVFELRHRCNTTQATNGLGLAASFGVVEVYANLIFRKVG